MPEIWEIVANPEVLETNPRVVSNGTFGSEFAIGRRTRQELLDLACFSIDGLEAQLEANKRLNSITGLTKGQGAEWGYELKHIKYLRAILEMGREVDERCLFDDWFPGSHFDQKFANRLDSLMLLSNSCMIPDMMANAKFIRDSDEFSAVRDNEASSLSDQRNSQLQRAQKADVPSLMTSYRTMKNDEIKHEALCIMEALETLFCRTKKKVLVLLQLFGDKTADDGPKKVLQEIIIDLFDYGHDMWLLRCYVDRLQGLEPRIVDRIRRQRVITEFEAGKFDRATTRLANRLKSQLSCLGRIAEHEHCWYLPPSDGLISSLEKTHERAMAFWEGYDTGSSGTDAKDLMEMLIFRAKSPQAQLLVDVKGLDGWGYEETLLRRLHKKLEDRDDRQHLFEILGQDFIKTVFEGACDLWQVNISTLGDTILGLDICSTVPE